MGINYRYHHIGIPTTDPVDGERHIESLKIFATDHESNPFGIQWMRYEEGCAIPNLVRRIPHVAFEVDDLEEAIRGKKVIIKPNSPSPGVRVAFIEESGAPVEFLEFA
jgi:hypothetical protein